MKLPSKLLINMGYQSINCYFKKWDFFSSCFSESLLTHGDIA